MSFRHLSGEAREAVEYRRQDFTKDLWLIGRHLKVIRNYMVFKAMRMDEQNYGSEFSYTKGEI